MRRLQLHCPPVLSCLALAIGWFVASFAGGQTAPRQSDPQLILLDGKAVSFQSLEITGGKLSGNGVPADLTLDDLRRIEISAAFAPPSEQPPVVVELRGEGRILATDVTLADDQCKIAWMHGEPLSVPIDAVRAIRLQGRRTSEEFERALSTPSAEFDRLIIQGEGDKLDSITGLIDSLSADAAAVEIEGQVRPLPRTKLFGIVVAQPDATSSPPAALLILGDGSQIGGELVSLSDGKAMVQIEGGGKALVPWSAISRVIVRSSRVAFLSDLKPLAEEQVPIVTLPRPWQKDKSVTGQPLKLGSREFEKGIGVHARSSLTFAAERKYDALAATIGIDAGTQGKGDCVFRVLGDGQPLYSRRMKASDAPHDLRLDIEGIEQVTLLVESGADLDLADHADWCDARFIKQRD
jgi:hypothetical protein